MNVVVVEVLPDKSVVEFTDDDGYIQRRVIPQGLFAISRKGPVAIPDEVVMLGLEYSNVDLVSTLGEELPHVRVRDLEDRLRRAGLWTRQDYVDKPGVVSGVWQGVRGADTTTILNAAMRGVK